MRVITDIWLKNEGGTFAGTCENYHYAQGIGRGTLKKLRATDLHLDYLFPQFGFVNFIGRLSRKF